MPLVLRLTLTWYDNLSEFAHIVLHHSFDLQTLLRLLKNHQLSSKKSIQSVIPLFEPQLELLHKPRLIVLKSSQLM